MTLPNLCRQSIHLLNKKWPHAIQPSRNKNKFHPRSSLNGLQERTMMTAGTALFLGNCALITSSVALGGMALRNILFVSKLENLKYESKLFNIQSSIAINRLESPLTVKPLKWYGVAGPGECIARFGFGIKDISFSKKAVIWPFQKGYIIDTKLRPYLINTEVLDTQSSPRLKMEELSCTWTIGPGGEKDLTKYARELIKKRNDGLMSSVSEIIELEIKKYFSRKDKDEDFDKKCNNYVIEVLPRVQEKIKPLGLRVYEWELNK